MHIRIHEINRRAIVVRTHKLTHAVYFAAVAVEGHGVYATAGAVLRGFAVLSVFVDVGE